MKNIFKIMVLLIFISINSKANAQQEKGYYYFGWAYSYDLETLIITPVKYVSCEKHSFMSDTDVGLQWHDYIKAEYKQYFKYTIEKSTGTSRKEEETYRRKVMGRWKHSVVKVNDFTYYCE